MTEQFYVAIELARVGRISAAIEDFYVAIELVTTENSAAHDRAGLLKVGVQDNVALCCVATEAATRAQQTKPGASDRPSQAHTTGLGRAQQRCAHNRGNLSR